VTSDDRLLHREEAFHDAWASSVDPATVPVQESFTLPTCPENRWIHATLGDVRGKTVLELGAGLGEASTWFAMHGAHVIATDLSGGMLAVARRVAARHGTTVTPVQMDGGVLSLADASVDIVYGANVLHHVDQAQCLREVHRVLRPGGVAAFWDPLRYNPAINVYRRLATQVRTEDEHPLGVEDLRLMRRTFRDVEARFFWLASLGVFVWFFLGLRIHPNAERYWKKIITDYASIAPLHRVLASIDVVLLGIPGLRWLAWNMAVVCRK
jgi:SAM-dependent methyltransferase